jgi:hypothetical protein
MRQRRLCGLPDPIADSCKPAAVAATDKAECLEQILRAFFDIADHDDIHQAAERLKLVTQWIDSERQRAAADPIFARLRLV